MAIIEHPLLWVGIVIVGMLVISGYLGQHRTNPTLGTVQAQNQSKQAQAQQPDTGNEGQRATKENQIPAAEYEPDCSDSKNADLCAQRRMAKAAEEQIGLNWVGIILLGFTLGFTAWAAFSARDAARYAARAVDVHVRVEQPILVVDKMTTRIDPPVWQEINFSYQNLGRSPAILIEWSAECMGAESLPDFPEYTNVTYVRGTVMRAHATDQVHIELAYDRGYTEVASGKWPIFFWGYFRYEDVFGRTRKTGFCYRGEHTEFGPLHFWRRHGGSAYNYDREEK